MAPACPREESPAIENRHDPAQREAIQERGKVKKDLILDATLAVISESGPSGVSLRSVAARAGVPASSVSYYYPTIVLLIQAAFGRYVSGIAPAIVGTVYSAVGDDRDLSVLAPVVAEQVSSRSGRMLLPLYELYLVVARHPDTYAEVATKLAELPDTISATFAELGFPNPDEIGHSVVAVVEGFGLRRALAQGEAGSDRKRVEWVLTRLFAEHLRELSVRDSQ